MKADAMHRRSILTLLGGAAAAWPLGARAQQRAVIAYLSVRSAESDVSMLSAFRRGLGELGFMEGQNLAIEYRYADGQYDRLPALVMELIQRRVGVIVFAGVGVYVAGATWQQLRNSRIPVVFNTGPDPVQLGIVSSINRPGGNFTGIWTLVGALTGKTFGLLHEFLPNARTIAILEDRNSTGLPARDAQEAAAALGIQALLLTAGESEIEAAFAGLSEQHADAIHVTVSPLFVARAKQIAALAARYKVPASYGRREFAEAGGLMSYGYDVNDGYRQMGVYAGRILKGDKPADLPVFRPTKFELIINMKTAKSLGLTVPDKLLALADDVIE